MTNLNLQCTKASRTVTRGSFVVVSCSLHKFCWKRGACVSQMFDSHKLKVCSIAREFIIPIILDDCIEQGYRVDPSELGTDNTCSAGASWSSESLLRDNDDVTL